MTQANNALIRNDPIVARNFYLKIDGINQPLVMQGLNAIDMHMSFVQTTQNGPQGKQVHVKTVGLKDTEPPEVVMTRMAPVNAAGDPIWKWFDNIRKKGFSSRSDQNRKTLTIQLYDIGGKQVGEYRLDRAWPYKIETSEATSDGTEPMKETITFACEFVDRTM